MTVQPLAALIAYKTGRAVKCKLTRAESLLIHPKRHPFEMDFTMGVDENGIIQGVKAKVVSDTGAYASLGGPVLERACTHAAGPYAYENFEIDGYAYYTNNPPAGAFRGFGVTQTADRRICRQLHSSDSGSKCIPDWRTLRNEELRFSFSGSERKTVFRRYFRLESGLFCRFPER